MKLERLRLLRNEINYEMNAEVSAAIYYFHGDAWHELDNQSSPSKQIQSNINKARENTNSEPFRPAKSKAAWFSCDEIDCVISLIFNIKPQKKTLDNFQTRLGNVARRAVNSYKVSYNQLTQLLARDSFRENLGKLIDWTSDVSVVSSETHDAAQDKTLAILALDIDYFKQVNDTYGHLYGDQVLKIFAIRLEQCAKSIAEKNETVEISIGHPSGEEFLISVSGCITKESIIEWANDFRTSICDEPLPSESEWKKLSEKEDLSPIIVPQLHERNVTTSIGVAFYNPIPKTITNENKIIAILEDADTALYRAKSSGRNQVIQFDEILDLCGRVLEHDQVTNVIAIDIGGNVGVLLGQEFKVFPPGYTGKRKFTVSDGRTTRTIGIYPRIELTTITVFNVQPELSFAYISDINKTATVIDSGSTLEAIPTGSIGHLLTNSSRYLPNSAEHVKVGDFAGLQGFIKDNLTSGNKIFSIVFRFSAAQVYLKKYGSAALNESLAKLFREVSGNFNVESNVGVLDSGSICVVGRDVHFSKSDLVRFFHALKSDFSELLLKIGVFCQSDIDSDNGSDLSGLEAEYSIEYSRYAASDHAANSNDEIVYFNHQVAVNILNSQRKLKAYKQGIADFESLKKIGVESTSLMNIAGLLYYSDGDFRTAADLFENAINNDPNNFILKTNFGTATYSISEFSRGLKVLNTLTDDEIIKAKDNHKYGYLMYALHLAKAKIMGLDEFNDGRFRVMSANVLAMDEYKDSPRVRDILYALKL